MKGNPSIYQFSSVCWASVELAQLSQCMYRSRGAQNTHDPVLLHLLKVFYRTTYVFKNAESQGDFVGGCRGGEGGEGTYSAT